MTKKIVIIGGGAAGFFAAINTAENAKRKNQNVEVQILEATGKTLAKVAISGGGRCNVTHYLFEPRAFCERYPRGSKELLSGFQRFQAKDTVEWFKERGVELVPEEDGRMFPITNTSETIIRCFQDEVARLGVEVKLNHKVDYIQKTPEGLFEITLRSGDKIEADAIMIATGSNPAGHQLAKDLGHTITPLAPSLFSFKIDDPLISELSGLSFESSETKLIILNEKPFKEKGPMLITHWGLSGPAVLKISAWAAREMQNAGYNAKLIVNWLGLPRIESAQELLKQKKEEGAKSQIQNIYPELLAKRFWLKMLERAQVPVDKRWSDVSKKEIQTLAEVLFATEFQILGKNRYKDEFVECGGVDLKEINFKTMESKIVPGLYFSGEVLDVDGITGGFNFQNAWTGSWIAAQVMSEHN